jgi:MoaA/NifB/PqqE/SkfB family radical SAM enzyme
LIISPYIVTDNRFDNLDRKEALQFQPGDIQKMMRFYEGGRLQWDYHRQAMVRFLKSGVMVKPCTAGFNCFFIRSTGDVFPCSIKKLALGNLREDSFETLIRSPAAKYFRRRAGTLPECQSCTEPGLERYSLPFEGFTYLSYSFKDKDHKRRQDCHPGCLRPASRISQCGR